MRIQLKLISIKDLVDKIKDESISFNDSYIKSYPEFIDYFKNLETITEHNLIIASHFVYGWMPTILTLNLSNKKEVLTLLNNVKEGVLLDEFQLKTLKECINNSIIGVSKLLHFINPTCYAIWDSNIYRFLSGNRSNNGANNTKIYLHYLELLKRVKNDSDFEIFYKNVNSWFVYDISDIRAIEVVLFELGKGVKQKQ